MMRQVFLLALLIPVLFGCHKKRSDPGHMDTVAVGRSTPNYMPDKCSKTLHIPESNPIDYTRRLLLNNHNENLECSPDLEHYRLVSSGIVLDFEITASGEKRGWIHFTFLDKKDSLKRIEDAVMAKKIRLDRTTVAEVFDVIDSLNMDEIYEVKSEWMGYVEGHNAYHAVARYEYSTPTVYYLQDKPECDYGDAPCMEWVKRLDWFTHRVDMILAPHYASTIEALIEGLEKKGIVRI